MPEARFLQIHTLTPYVAALLNRDDTGLAKRLLYGGKVRTRISSQCLKRHWRMADDPHALHRIDGAEPAFRSRELVTQKVIGELSGSFPEPVVSALNQWFQWAVYSGNKKKAPKKVGQPGDAEDKSKRQTILLGAPEIRWLQGEFEKLARQAGDSGETAFELGKRWALGDGKGNAKKKRKDDDDDETVEADNKLTAFRAEFTRNFETLKRAGELPGGLTAALFGRMVTSDPEANITAPVHVAHAFTVHAEESESDYFTAVDDLAEDEPGADTIQETELTSGLFYAYVVVDLPGLRENLGGDARLMGDVLHNLIYLIAEVSPGAKLGSTAPYGRSALMLLEAGDRQPRSLAEAFREPCAPQVSIAEERLWRQLALYDKAYATGEERRALSLSNGDIPVRRGSLADLAQWARDLA